MSDCGGQRAIEERKIEGERGGEEIIIVVKELEVSRKGNKEPG